MKIALCTVGSTGDVQPFIALALALQANGHHVRVLSHPFHEERFTSRGIDYVACGPVVTQEELNDMLSKMLEHWYPIKQLEMLMTEAFFAEGEKYFRECKAGLAGFDLAICHMVDFLGSEAATQLGIPRISVILAPTGIPTSYTAMMVGNLGFLNRFSYRLVRWMTRKVDRKCVQFLESLGGTEQHIERFHTLSKERVFVAASPTLARTYPDLPEHFKVTGPWILAEPEFSPDAELLDFFERYPQPVIVSFGSMGGNKGAELTSTVLEALKISGKPAVIQSGYAGLFADSTPENILFAGYVPHGWLFEKGACVVHHGGAGTTTAVCRAGVPSVVVTFIADQPYFGLNLKRLGIAPKMIWIRHLNAKRLAKRILQATQPDMQERARALRSTFLSEEGSNKAVTYIEQFAREKALL